MDKNRINLCLSRQNFRIVSDESVEYLRTLESTLNERINRYQRQYPSMSNTRCILLAMFSMEDELYKMKKNYEILEEKIYQLRGIPRYSVAASKQKEPSLSPIAKEETEKEHELVGV
ncbi:MAG: cell division protein ZapA [Clostridia bacterium]|nr:cell division protein ZapA [Clostridia bacterium]